MTWMSDKPTEPGLYWWRWGVRSHDEKYAEGGEIVRVWVEPQHLGSIWWVTHFDKGETEVELQFTGGEWWPERIKTPGEQVEEEEGD